MYKLKVECFTLSQDTQEIYSSPKSNVLYKNINNKKIKLVIDNLINLA